MKTGNESRIGGPSGDVTASGRVGLGAPMAMRWVSAAVFALAGSCAPAPMPVATSTHDPSNPSAPEGIMPATATSASSLGAQTGSGADQITAPMRDASAQSPVMDHSAHSTAAADGGSDAAVYVCPMHPEVTAKTPGVCPKCNMKLVPKK